MKTQFSRSLRMLLLGATAVFLAAVGLIQTAQTALAHTRVEVGPYVIVIGWLQEPPIVGERNALTIEITENEQPVTDAEATLDVEVPVDGGLGDPRTASDLIDGETVEAHLGDQFLSCDDHLVSCSAAQLPSHLLLDRSDLISDYLGVGKDVT